MSKFKESNHDNVSNNNDVLEDIQLDNARIRVSQTQPKTQTITSFYVFLTFELEIDSSPIGLLEEDTYMAIVQLLPSLDVLKCN